jgi:putative SOS response-associated peptidase YedK
MLTPDAYDAWLGLDLASAEQATNLLMYTSARVAETLEIYPVDARVGNVRNSGPELITPLA